MASEEYIFRITDAGSAKRLEANFVSVAKRIAAIGKANPDFAPFSASIKKEFDAVSARAQKLKAEMATITSALGKPRVPLSGELAGLGGLGRSKGFAGDLDKLKLKNSLVDRAVLLDQLRIGQMERIVELEKQIASAPRDARVFRESNSLQAVSRDLAKRVAGLATGGERRSELIAERRAALVDKETEALKQLAAVRDKLRNSTFGVGADLLRKEAALTGQILKIEQQKLQTVKAVNAARAAAAKQGFSGPDAISLSGASDKERAAFTEAQTEAYQRLLAAREKDVALATRLATLESERAGTTASLAQLEKSGGAQVGTAALLDRILDINKALTRLDTGELEEVNKVIGIDLNNSVSSLLERFHALNNVEVLDPESAAELNLVNREMRELLTVADRIGTKGIPLSINADQLLAQLPLLERTLIGAFKGLAQRFRTTLQFAISGALIFQVQRLAREFVKAAIEVERTFADVATSLTFDIEAPRGSAEFSRVLDDVRQKVLQIADDYNVLPTEVNQAAFIMISRFRDVDAALVATRAQMLATRVATIAQAESLRALTGIAEVYGIQFASITDATERQRKQAALYTQVLDKATVIQQKFGIPVEDTLEGAVQLAENFRLLGFSIDETLAIVSTAVIRTGQTGQAVADRLARSFGQISSPQTRNDLLSLARTFDSFELTEADFASGRDALTAIFDQFSGFDDTLKARVSSIIGQRRETAFVSSVLGGADEIVDVLDSTADAAGAAERRVGILLETTQGSLEGIKAAFFSLAQNLESLGFLKPISAFLRTLEFIFDVVNKITSSINKLINRLNFIRMPSALGGGLGDALKITLSLSLAALSFKRIIEAIQVSRIVSGLTKAGSAVAGFAAVGAGEAAARGVGAEGAVFGTAVFVNFRKSLKLFVEKPLVQMNRVFPRLTTAFLALSASLTGTAAVTASATAAENTLSFARARAAVVGFAAALRSGAFFTGLLSTVGGALTALSKVFSKFFVVLGIITAAFAAFEAARLGIQVPAAIFGAGSRKEIDEGELTKRAEALVETGEVSSVTAGKIRILRDFIEELGTALDNTNTTGSDFLAAFPSIIPGVSEAEFGGTQANALRNLSIQINRLVQEQINEYQDSINDVYSRVNPAFGPINTAPGLAAVIESGVGQFAEDYAEVRKIQEELNAIGDPLEAAGDIGTQRRIHRELSALEERLGLLPDAARLAEENLLQNFREVGSLVDIQGDLTELQSRVSLGRISPADARGDLVQIRDDLLEFRKQAIFTENFELVKEIDAFFLVIAQEDLSLFQQAGSSREQSLNRIQDVLLRQRAVVEGMRGDLALATEAGFGFEIIRVLIEQIALADREIADAVKEEARQRLQAVADSSDSLRERVDALKRLRDVVQLDLIGKGVEAALYPALFRVTLEDEQKLVAAEKTLADAQLELAQLRVKNAINRQASSIDSQRSIRENIAALRVSIAFMRQRGADDDEIEAEGIRLEDQLTNLRLAEVERRAAFFRLTAGTGDEIRTAQADLRAALDRLSAIDAAGAGDTLAGYQAELNVLQAKQRLVEQAITMADLNRRVASDLTDPYEQALLDVQAAQDALRAATGSIEKAQAQQGLAEAESAAQKSFYDRQLSDLDFLFRTDQLGQASYIAALRTLQGGIDRTTRQGEDLWRDIELQILGLQDAAEQVFNIPTEIRLPTLFEVRRALAADALSVDYQDNRQQNINIFVSDNIEIDRVMAAIEDRFGGFIDIDAARVTAGGAGITIGSFG